MLRAWLLAAFVAVAGGTAASAQTTYKYPFQDPALPAEQRIDDLVSRMTLDEKIDLLGRTSAIPRLGVPAFGFSEGIHGVVQRGENPRFGVVTTTQFPQPPGLGESWDPEMVRQAADVEGYEARWISGRDAAKHPTLLIFGPQADLMRDPRWGRSEEIYGEDPFLNGTMAAAFVRGLQGDDPRYWQTAALLKHFLANTNENGRGSSSSNFDERLFFEYYSVPFRMGFEAGAKGVMAAYNAWNGVPMAVNPVLNRVLIDRWGVEMISSDSGAVTNLVNLYKAFPNREAAVVAVIHAGVNLILDRYKDETLAALKDGSLSEKDIDPLVRRKLFISLKLGLLDPPGANPYEKIKDGPEPWTTERDKAVSRRMALESVVLLKNAKGLLPLDRAHLKSVAVIGPLADSVHWDWYGGFPPYAVSPLTGIRAALGPDVKVNYAADNANGAAEKAARESDVAIVVVGNDPTCGPNMAHDWIGDGTKPCASPSDGREGRDRESLTLGQEELVKQVLAANPKTVMVLVSSFPFAINWSQDHVPAILHMTHASQDEGNAIAAVLLGRFDPGGHLTATWPASLDQLPPMMDYDIRHGRTYMYFKGKPLYPFGFGLSYTTFRYSNLRASAPAVAAGGQVTVEVDVTNTGPVAGDAVPQLYVAHLGSKVARPAEQLEGFQRVSLQPGETRTVRIPLKAAQLAYWNQAKGAFEVEPEQVRLMIGDSSADIKLSRTLAVK
jgi:beta-glucosidase